MNKNIIEEVMKWIIAIEIIACITLIVLYIGKTVLINKDVKQEIIYPNYEVPLSFPDSVKLQIELLNIAHPDIVYKQAVIESGNFNSDIFLKFNNMFGMKRAYKRPNVQIGYIKNDYAIYENWQMSIVDYAIWQAWSGRGLNRDGYLDLLGRVYATDSMYINKLK